MCTAPVPLYLVLIRPPGSPKQGPTHCLKNTLHQKKNAEPETNTRQQKWKSALKIILVPMEQHRKAWLLIQFVEYDGSEEKRMRFNRAQNNAFMEHSKAYPLYSSWFACSTTFCALAYFNTLNLVLCIRDTHGKDFRPIFDHFSLQFLFNFTANLTFFAVKLKENWNENWPKIGYREHPGRVILEKRVKIGSKAEPEGVRLTGWNETLSCRTVVDNQSPLIKMEIHWWLGKWPENTQICRGKLLAKFQPSLTSCCGGNVKIQK